LLATAIGEESFTDGNANGAFDTGESFFDTSEYFRDDAQTGSYAAGDYFFDFNNNGTRDGPDGIFEGVLCNDVARCDATKKSAGIGQQNVIIMSGSAASIDPMDSSGAVIAAPTTMALNSSLGLLFWVRDVNGNVMPGGTTIALSASGSAGLQVVAPSTYTVPCTAPLNNAKVSGATAIPFTLTSAATNGSSVVTVTVTTPLKFVTIYQFTITV
jgi:hypothetical protein